MHDQTTGLRHTYLKLNCGGSGIQKLEAGIYMGCELSANSSIN